jgi:cytochrome c oxidase subunit 1
VSVLLFLVNVFHSRRRGEIAGSNPWRAASLEWAPSSPPPRYNFGALPTVTGRYALWEGLENNPVVLGLSTERRETLCTSVMDAKPEHRYEMAADSILPFLLSLVTGGFFVGLIFAPWTVPVAAVLWTIVLALWFWRGTEQPMELHKPDDYHRPRGPHEPALALGAKPPPMEVHP